MSQSNVCNTTPDHVSALDGWRGLAILGVLFAHFITPFPINLGRFGVELFFVLSGRLMADILFVRGSQLNRFYGRRVARIYPALLVFIILTSSAAFWIDEMQINLPAALASASLTYNYYYIIAGDRVPLLDHIWSLCVEEHMYILLGLVALLHRRFKVNPAVLISALCLAFFLNGLTQSTIYGLGYYDVYWRSDVRGASILAGAAAFLLLRSVPMRENRLFHLGVLFCGAAAFMLNFNQVPDFVKYTVGTLFLAVVVAALEVAPRYVRGLLEWRILTVIGVSSYSMYLWQQPFSKLEGGSLLRVVALGLAVTLAVVSLRAVEAPSRRYLNAFVDRCARRPARTPASPLRPLSASL